MTAGIDAARLPFLIDLASTGRPGGKGGGQDHGGEETGPAKKRGGRRTPVECACLPEPRRIQLTPKQIQDGPIICGLCCAPFDPPEDQGSAEGSCDQDRIGMCTLKAESVGPYADRRDAGLRRDGAASPG